MKDNNKYSFLSVVIKVLVMIPITLALILVSFQGKGAYDIEVPPEDTIAPKIARVDSLMKAMTPDERLGQLFMVEASAKWGTDSKLFKEVEYFVDSCHIGGVIFFYGGPVREAMLINRLQSRSKIPLMIAQDGEWGLSMRLDSVPQFPRNLCLGAIENEDIIYHLGREIGRECKRMGVNIDFMPCVDIYDNPKNTVIANRSFGSNPLNVAQKGTAIMAGMQEEGILTTAKHFPGHGNTDVDSHEALPVINDSKERIDSFSVFPFKYMIKNGVWGVMVGHLFVPSLETGNSKTPASISKIVVKDYLCKTLNFNGLVFTDALRMKGVSADYSSGELELKAFNAGVDVFLMPTDCKRAYNALKVARNSGKISQKDIDERCRKILTAKYYMGLSEFSPISIENMYDDINTQFASNLNRKIYENAITLVKNTNDILPLKDLDTNKVAVVSIGKDDNITDFAKYFNRYSDNVKKYSIAKTATAGDFAKLLAQLSNYDIVIIGIHGGHAYPSTFGTTATQTQFVSSLSKKSKVILDVFNSPLALSKFSDVEKCEAIVISYEDNLVSQEVSAQLILGSLPFKGKLPVNVATFEESVGIKTNVNNL